MTTYTDGFTGTDGTALLGSTSPAGGVYVGDTGWTIQGNAATPPPAAAEAALAFDAGSGDATIDITIVDDPTVGLVGLVGRWVDVDNMLVAGVSSAGSPSAILYQKVAGSYTVIEDHPISAIPGKVLRLVMAGSALELWFDGVQIITATDGSLAANTQHGLLASDAETARLDDLVVDTAAAPTLTIGSATLTTTGGDLFVPGDPQTINLAGAISGPVAHGPMITRPGEVIPPMVVTVVDRSNPYVALGTLDQSFARTWQDQISEPGAGSVSIDNRDPDIDLITDTSMLRFELNGVAQFLALPARRTQVTIAPGEEHDQITTLAGPGHLAVLADSLVYPSRGPGSLPIEEDRIFSWPSPDYDDTGWIFATELVRQDATTQWWQDLPNALWPDPTAWWIWAHQGSELSAPEGTCYFRRTFTLTDPTNVFLAFTCDDTGAVFMDGIPLPLDAGLRGVGLGPVEIRTTSIGLSAGEHVLAVEGTNSPPNPDDTPGTTNPAGFLLAMYSLDAFGSLDELVLHSDASWRIVEYPDGPPGMTPGEVARILILEGIDRGSLPELMFLHFDDDVDSNGNPWPVVGDIATKVGTDCLTFFREMAGTYFDMWMGPGGFDLYLFTLDQQGNDTLISWHGPSDDTRPESGNLEHLVHVRDT